jgi:23S rRNA (guanosine2251-2'-O)-methyltransferase
MTRHRGPRRDRGRPGGPRPGLPKSDLPPADLATSEPQAPARHNPARHKPARHQPARQKAAPNPPGPRPPQPQPVAARSGEPRGEGRSGAGRAAGAWLYGQHAVAAALANPRRRVKRLLATPERAGEAERLLAAARAALPDRPLPEIAAREALAALLPEGAVHQGLALAAAPLDAPSLDEFLDGLPAAGSAPQIIVLLDQVSDPHNVGAMLRSAAAFGALALILPEHGTPEITGSLAKSASGAVEHVPLIRVINLARAIDRLKDSSFWSVGLDEAAPRSLAATGLTGRVALVLGAEGEGMRRLTRERCDHLARLPTRGAIASLNVSNAAAVALYELTRTIAEPTP